MSTENLSDVHDEILDAYSILSFYPNKDNENSDHDDDASEVIT